MKQLKKTRYAKHKHTFAFHPGNTVETLTMPAYHSSGLKTYERQLQPLADPRVIDCRRLASMINKKCSGNIAEVTNEGFLLNGYMIRITEGFASTESLKFRFMDVWDLLMNLKQEKILHGSIEDLRTIKASYYDNN